MKSDKETIDDLITNNLKIIQSTAGFRFSLDAVLLAHFVTIQNAERILDLGSGTGVISLLLTTRAADLTITGLEIQPEMVAIAKRSVQINHLEKQIKIDEGDLKKAVNYYERGGFDVVVSNPPFQRLGTGRVNPNPALALARHELACCLADVVSVSAQLLKSRGRLALVHRPNRLAEIINLFDQFGLAVSRLRLVHPQINRPANLVLIEGEKGKQVDPEVLPPLIVYDETGSYTRELYQIYYPNEGRPTKE